MSVSMLLKDVGSDTVGPEVTMRTIGTRDPPARVVLQIEVTGTANVQIQARVARDAPWLNVGPIYSTSSMAHVEPVQFMRAATHGMVGDSSVTVWAVWGW